ncbi:hypothetical protein JOM56_000327 [Amanita muscaria]
MSHSPRKSKRARFATHRSSGSNNGGMVVFTPKKTRRGNVTYQEVDASPYYRTFDDEEDTPSRKIPKVQGNSSTVLNHDFEELLLEDGFTAERRKTKFYQAVSLLDLGFTLNLGHGGRVCPNNMEEGSSDWSCHRFTILDSAGIFVHHVRWCRCNGVAVEDKHLQLVRARLFPSSITKPQTAFTFDVLDQFLIDALECKTSAMSFYQKLRRLTDNAFPNLLPDRYRELMRVSRVWRDLSNRKRAGFGHDTQREPGPGELAIFCPACPQPGINLPERWSEIYDSDAVALRYVLDGNFTAQHMKMKRPEDDVALSDGLGYMVNDKCYQSHIRSAADNKDKSACHNHRAVNSANTNKSNLRATGIGATACARHGCFVPHSVVDFYKGEQQKNIDYSVCQAIGHNSDGLQKALIIYDVACQWYTKFQRRVESYSSLSLPEGLEIVPAVGKFHLSAHKLDCFARFSLMFTRGAGHIDGEILETLWSSFNKVSPTARSMSLAHRQELYDDHMRDSNWKKLVGLVKALCKKHKAACNGVEATKAPTLAEIRLNLVESGMTSSRTNGSVNWLVDGISIENAQDALRAEIRCLSSNPTTTQKTVIAQKRQRLLARITNFNEAGDAFTGGSEIDVSPPLKDNPGFCREENGDELDDSIEEEFWQGEQDEDDDADDGNFNFDDELIESNPEIFKLWMPSSIGGSAAVDMGLEVLVEEEIQLRVGQANDCLDDFANSSGSKQEIRRLVLRINQDVRGYHRAREALISLGASEEILQKYQLITPNDLTVNKDVTEENRLGQSSDVLAWFWRIEGVDFGTSQVWTEEFYRVSWLKAKARYERWDEELKIVKHEMCWTILWFKHQEHVWERRFVEHVEPGLQAYAAKQRHIWERFKKNAEDSFGKYIMV